MRFLIVQHDADAGPGTLEAPFLEQGVELDHWSPPGGEPAPAAGEHDALVVLGGVANPDQDAQHPWLTPEVGLIRDALARDVPVLGVCLGGQLLARAAGGRVGPARRSEIGWHPVGALAAAADDPVLGGLPAGFRGFQWHHYGFAPPPGAALLARTDAADQAFRLGGTSWGLQFHIEVTPAIILAWLDSPAGQAEVARYGVDEEGLRRDTRELSEAYAQVARDVATRFARVVAARLPSVRP